MNWLSQKSQEKLSNSNIKYIYLLIGDNLDSVTEFQMI